LVPRRIIDRRTYQGRYHPRRVYSLADGSAYIGPADDTAPDLEVVRSDFDMTVNPLWLKPKEVVQRDTAVGRFDTRFSSKQKSKQSQQQLQQLKLHQ